MSCNPSRPTVKDPEEFTLPQLPFFFEDDVENSCLPLRPQSICPACWEGPFAMHLGLPLVSPRNGQWYRRWPGRISYWTLLTKIESSASAGCIWCQFIIYKTSGKAYYRGEALNVTVEGTTYQWGSEEGQSVQTLHVNMNGYPSRLGGLQTLVYTALDDPAQPYFALQNPILDVKAPRALDLARQHIDKCVRGHKNCIAVSVFPAGTQALLPKRLVDCTDIARPRLVSSTQEHSQYLALSYVWGEDQVHKTTESNISTYEQVIAPAVLPATIRDAIYVTHMLGFRWLWIDSLCIIQDSKDEKQREIGRMHHIYRYAHLTIIAASAERVSEGFLHKQPPPPGDIALPFICPWSPPVSPVGYRDDRLVAQSRVGQVYLSSSYGADGSYSDELGCMATRAWCMQEYLLSPRSLIFTPRALLFRCRTAVQCVGNSPRAISDDPQLPDTLFLPVPSAAKPGSKEWEDVHNAWLEIVENYSHRTAKEESDKLVACGAIAEHFYRVLRSEYLAGLWRSDTLLTDLLWSVTSGGARTPKVYRAPSWSWAAVEGSIRHPLQTLQSEDIRTVVLAEILECWVTLENDALLFGQVTGGLLVLRGTLIPCRGRPVRDRDGCWSVRLPSFEQLRRQQGELPSLHLDEEYGANRRVKRRNHTLASIEFDCRVDELPRSVWVVPFVLDKRRAVGEDYDQMLGIVLELAPPSSNSGGPECKKACFRRFGCLQDLFIVAEKAVSEHPLWDPLARAIKDGEWPLLDITIV